MNEVNLKSLLIGASIQWIKRTCNIIMLHIKRKDGASLSLHVECFFRIVKNSKTLASSNDMYFPGTKANKRRFKWDKPGTSLFDDSISSCEEEFTQNIISIGLLNNELTLKLANEVLIEIIPDTVSDSEAYILFSYNETYLVCNNP